MKKLISMFQERLDVSKQNAITRVILFLTLILCFAATIVITVWIFPYHSSYPTSNIKLPAGNYEVAMKISEQGIQLNEKQFYQKTSSVSDTIFIFVFNNGNATFMTNINRTIFYCKRQIAEIPFFYEAKNVEFKNGILTFEEIRSTTAMILAGIILPFLFLLVLSGLILNTESKKDGYGYNDKHKFEQKYKEVF